MYSTYPGGTAVDRGYAIAADAQGHANVTGIVMGDAANTFPVAQAFQPTYRGSGEATPPGSNAFVTKLNPIGSGLVYSTFYSTYMGSGGFDLYDYGQAITVDGAGFAHLTGSTATGAADLFTGHRFPIVNAFQPEPGGGFSTYYPDAFVTQMTPQGALVYSSYLGGSYRDEGHGIAVDAAGTIYVTGMTMSADFPTTADASQGAIGGGGCSYPLSCPDAFVTRIGAGTVVQPPRPDIRANGQDGPLTLAQGETLRVTVALEPGSGDGSPADWWVAVVTPFGVYWYTLDQGWVWSAHPVRLYGGPLFRFPPTPSWSSPRSRPAPTRSSSSATQSPTASWTWTGRTTTGRTST